MPDNGQESLRPKGLPERYQILSLLGQGGFASVFKALDSKTDRLVAIKWLHPEHLASVEKRGRFEREMTVCHKLKHPNIIKVEAAMVGHNVAYIVMEFLQAQSLSDALKSRRFELRESLRIIAQVASALGYIHNSGLVHRDIKPENIMVCPNLRTVLTDFSLVRLPYRTSFSGVGSVLGTPYYVAPEVVMGADPSPRTDIYAMGLVFYELLTGTQAFNVRGIGALLKAIVESNIVPPSEVRPELTPAVDSLLAKCAAKDPQQRYGSARAFLQDLARVGSEGRDAVESVNDQFPGGKISAAIGLGAISVGVRPMLWIVVTVIVLALAIPAAIFFLLR